MFLEKFFSMATLIEEMKLEVMVENEDELNNEKKF